jgi:hypothetical protein
VVGGFSPLSRFRRDVDKTLSSQLKASRSLNGTEPCSEPRLYSLGLPPSSWKANGITDHRSFSDRMGSLMEIYLAKEIFPHPLFIHIGYPDYFLIGQTRSS